MELIRLAGQAAPVQLTPIFVTSRMTDNELSTSYLPSLYRPPSLLPIAKHRSALLYLVETNPVTVVIGQTGSGKTTQIPQYLEQAGWCENGKVVAVTQVRKECK